jgi:quercetin dioxygenase-like cupin family protein
MNLIEHAELRPLELPGRTLRMHASPGIGNAKKLSMNVVRLKAGETSYPAHSHPGAEERVHVLRGHVEFFVLNGAGRHFQRRGPGDSIVFQEDDIPMTRNVGDESLELACFFSPAAPPETYGMLESMRYGDEGLPV